MKNIISVCFLMVLVLTSGCGTSQFSRGTYDDPDNVNLLSDKFSESTAQLLAQSVINQLKVCPSLNPNLPVPFVAIEGIQNRTEEMIDLKMVANLVKTELIRSGKFRFIDKDAREALEQEYQYNDSGVVDSGSKKVRGKQKGADYLLTGDLSSIVQQAGRDKTVYYQMTVNLTNTETSSIDCVATEKARPKFKKHRE